MELIYFQVSENMNAATLQYYRPVNPERMIPVFFSVSKNEKNFRLGTECVFQKFKYGKNYVCSEFT